MKKRWKEHMAMLVAAALVSATLGVTAFAEAAKNTGTAQDSTEYVGNGISKATDADADYADPEESKGQEETKAAEESKDQEESDKPEETGSEIADEQGKVNEVPAKKLTREVMAATPPDASEECIPAVNPRWEVGENAWVHDGKTTECPGWGMVDRDALTKEELLKTSLRIEVFKDGVSLGGWGTGSSSGDFDLRAYFNESGVYTFRASYCPQTMMNWRDIPEEAWSELSDEYTYVKPEKEAAIPVKAKWGAGGKASWEDTRKTTGGYPNANAYCITLKMWDEYGEEYDTVDILWANKTERDLGTDLEKGQKYKFSVYALGDLQNYANSQPSWESDVFFVGDVSEEASSFIKDILNKPDDEITGAVETGIDDKDTLENMKLAVQADRAVADNLKALEEKYQTIKTGSAAGCEVKNESGLIDQNKVSIIGGVLNGASSISFKAAEDVEDGQLSAYKRFIALDISLDNDDPENLKFPVLITMPVPTGIHYQNVAIIHYLHDGSKETIWPRLNSDGTISFAVTSFSQFAFVDTSTTEESNTTRRSFGGGGTSRVGGKATGVAGTWIQDSVGWWFKTLEGTYPKSQWLMTREGWFRFDDKGYMMTGWFTDTDGHKYYLNPISDGTRGMMKTGWQQIEGTWYYFSNVSNGTKGALLVNTTTPDGYRVDGNGVWNS